MLALPQSAGNKRQIYHQSPISDLMYLCVSIYVTLSLTEEKGRVIPYASHVDDL